MTEPKHTPGPWHWELTGGLLDPPQLEGNIEYSDCNPILICAGCSPSCMREYNKPCPLVPSEADRALIADAWQLPDLRKEIAELKEINKEMYEALEHLRIVAQKVCDDFCCGAGCHSDATDCHLEAGLIRAEIALRKARGETE